ncbi:MAG: hypothetical protein KDA95_10725, partial [Acidimicrobiales bacterium]|nr:hypothetical protein [Acidimicrobiales bacterium]
MKTRRKAACLLMASAMVAACSNNSSDKSPTSSTTSLARPPASRAWKAVEDDPCRLLTKADVESIFDKQSVELVEVPPARSCRYRLDETTT